MVTRKCTPRKTGTVLTLLEPCLNLQPSSSRTWNFRLFASLQPALRTLKLYLKLQILGLSQCGSLGPWILEPGNLECWKYETLETLESWNCGTPNLASCNLRALLSCLQTASPVKNFEPFTLWSCRVDVLLWIILPIPCSLNKLQQLYWALRLLCIALVISLLMSQTKTLTSLERWCSEPWTLETWNPRSLVK